MTSERRELHGQTDFLANCGGFLGLFLGISVISLLEIVYFCTIRLWYNLKKPQTMISDPVEMIELKNDRTNRCFKVTRELIANYSNRTTIQGVNYVADTNLSLVERFWWAVVVVIAAFCCVSLIMDIVESYDQSPIIVSYANEEALVSEVRSFFLEINFFDPTKTLFSLDSISGSYHMPKGN
jgi:Amiloride-sensitive sodium channel